MWKYSNKIYAYNPLQSSQSANVFFFQNVLPSNPTMLLLSNFCTIWYSVEIYHTLLYSVLKVFVELSSDKILYYATCY